MSDKIKPNYYKVVGDYDVLDIIKALSEKSTLDGFTDHCRYHALKYLFRVGLKDDALQDLKKAAEFLAIGVKHLEDKINQEKLDMDTRKFGTAAQWGNAVEVSYERTANTSSGNSDCWRP